MNTSGAAKDPVFYTAENWASPMSNKFIKKMQWEKLAPFSTNVEATSGRHMTTSCLQNPEDVGDPRPSSADFYRTYCSGAQNTA